MSSKKTVEQTYQKKTQLEHILLRPDSYVGSVERDVQKLFVLVGNEMKEKSVEFVPALYKIFDEILVNASDNRQRDQNMKEIRVTIHKEMGYVSIKNDGKGIPVQIHKEHHCYVPELIFGHLLTSSNYDDKEKKTTGGRNGYGAKLANIFSTKFVVETVDMKNKKKYKQKWTENMTKKGEPTITDVISNKTKDYTKITFYPDFKRFGMEKFEDGILDLFIKRVYDIAGTTPKDLKVYLYVLPENDPDDDDDDNINNNDFDMPKNTKFKNGLLPINNFIDYAKMYIGRDAKKSKGDNPYFHCLLSDKDNHFWEIIFALSHDNDYHQCSHVNNIWTIKGGTHVTYIEKQFIKYFKENFKDKSKKIKEMVKPKIVKDKLFIFINCLVTNPSFSSQTKESLTTKTSQFSDKSVSLPPEFCKGMTNKIKDDIKSYLNFRMDQQGKKSDGKKQRRLLLPPEIDDAHDAGGKYSKECTLIITEGLSAKTLAVAGISALDGGQRRYGIFPLRGKLLNVRDASRAVINKNAEITNLKKILGLRHQMKYSDEKNFKTLRYGKVMIMTDQDFDGSHIKGLMVNFFHSEYPDLIRQPNFLQQFITPIVVCTKGKGNNAKKKAFYTLPEYTKWKERSNNGKGWTIKYYKGLGTWSRKDGKEHFRDLKKHKVLFKYQNNRNQVDDNAIIKAFSKKHADARKEWLENFEPGTYINYDTFESNHNNNNNNNNNRHSSKRVTYEEFIDRELILFSLDDNGRSIPNIVDGFKPGQRKILYSCFLKGNLKKELRVAQLGGYVSEKSAYHHGETSLYQTIIGMAQDFVGSNNINLLYPSGMFGSRLKGGKDAASARYIHTKLSTITRYIFIETDDLILDYLDDDGYPVEPKYYVPIIPMILVNGCEGIGTGWSTFIPNYDPKDIIKNLRKKLIGENFESMKPWYRGFNGHIIERNENPNYLAYRCYGNIELLKETKNNTNEPMAHFHVSELPIRSWTENYKKYLIDLEDTDQVENVINMSSDIDISFSFSMKEKKKTNIGKKKSKESTASNSRSTSPSKQSSDKEKKIKKKIYWSGSLDEPFLRDLKLSTSLTTSNMVLFDPDGKIKKYEKVEDILEDFYVIRLQFYTKRKNYLLKLLEHELNRITNQTRFILMIIENELIIAKKSKYKIVYELKELKFDTWQPLRNGKNKAKKNESESEQGEDEKDDDDDDDDGDISMDDNINKAEAKKLEQGYNYLLKMPLLNLTKEKVQQLQRKQEDTENEVNALKNKSTKDLWRADLDALEAQLEIFDNNYEETVEEMRRVAQEKRSNAATATKGAKTTRGKKKKVDKNQKKMDSFFKNDDDMDMDIDMKDNKKIKKLRTTADVLANLKDEPKKLKKSTKSKKAVAASNTNKLETFGFASMKKTTKQTKKRKLGGNSKNISDDPFAANKKTSKIEMDLDDDSSNSSAENKLSFAERVNLKRNSPQKKSRKRKRNEIESEEEHELSDMNSNEPPKKKRNISSSNSTSDSLPLKSIKSRNNQTKNKAIKKKIKLVSSANNSDFSDDDLTPFKPKRRLNKKNKFESDEEDESSYNVEEDSDIQMIDNEKNNESDDDIDLEGFDDESDKKVIRRTKRNRKKVNYREKTAESSNDIIVENENENDSDFDVESNLEIEESEEDNDSEYIP